MATGQSCPSVSSPVVSYPAWVSFPPLRAGDLSGALSAGRLPRCLRSAPGTFYSMAIGGVMGEAKRREKSGSRSEQLRKAHILFAGNVKLPPCLMHSFGDLFCLPMKTLSGWNNKYGAIIAVDRASSLTDSRLSRSPDIFTYLHPSDEIPQSVIDVFMDTLEVGCERLRLSDKSIFITATIGIQRFAEKIVADMVLDAEKSGNPARFV